MMDSVMDFAPVLRREDNNTPYAREKLKWTVVIIVGVIFVIVLLAVTLYLHFRLKKKHRQEDLRNHQLDDYGIDPQEPDSEANRGRGGAGAGAGAAKYRYDDSEVRRPESAHSNSNFGLQMPPSKA
jgi:flagellar biosynthesis/type III secretory pathway M-ring protein FliF/YscJ